MIHSPMLSVLWFVQITLCKCEWDVVLRYYLCRPSCGPEFESGMRTDHLFLNYNKSKIFRRAYFNNEKCIKPSVIRLGDFWILGNFSKPLATINLPNSPTFLGNFCKGVKNYHFSSEIIFGQLL